MTTQVVQLNDSIYRASIELAPEIPLHVHLIVGERYAVWIDSGVASMFSLLQETMALAGVTPTQLRFILHTHSHHDHMGCNAQIQDATGCLIAAHAHYAAWHADFERHYQEFARPLPHLIADTDELRDEVLAILDAPRPLDLHIDEGIQFNLGGDVTLDALSFPGHLLAELGWYEASTNTLILGDAVTGLDWPLFHSHLSVRDYRASLHKIARVIEQRQIQQVLFGHFPAMIPAEVEALLGRANAYIDAVESMIIRIIASHPQVTLEALWTETCQRMERQQEFRALNMVHAHVQDLVQREIIQCVDTELYQLR